MNLKESKKFVIDVSWVLLGNFSIVIVTFLQRMIIARFMGAAELGAYSLIMSIYAIGTAIIGIGIPMAITKYAAEIKTINQKIKELATVGLILSGATSLVAITLFPFFSTEISRLLNISDYKDVVLTLTLLFPFSTIFYTSLALLNGIREMKSYSILEALQNIIFLILTIFFLLSGFGLKSILLGLWISILIATAILFIVKHRYFSLKFDHSFGENAKRLLNFGVKVLATDLINQVNSYADFLLLGFFLSPESVGFYTVAISISRLIWIVPGCIQKISYPAASEYWIKKDSRSLNGMVNRIIKYSSIIAIVFGVGISLFAKEIIALIFGQGFDIAIIPLSILMLGIVLNGALVQSVGSLLSAIGRPELSLKVDAVTVAINILFNILLIPGYGIVGAAASKTISLICNTFLKMLLFYKIARLKIELKPFWLIVSIAIPVLIIKFIFSSIVMNMIIFPLFILIVFKLFYYGEELQFIRSLLAANQQMKEV